MQTYALQEYLKEKGGRVAVLDIRPFTRYPTEIAHRGRISRKALHILNQAGLLKAGEKQRLFDSFRKEHLHLTRRIYNLNRYLNSASDLTSIVVGSDQVWAPRFGKKAMETYLLMSVPDSINKVAYAACSYGVGRGSAEFERYEDGLSRFSGISVRDGFTRDKVAGVSDTAVEVVVDPSLLNELSFGISKSDLGVPEDYILYYGFSENGDRVSRSLSEEYGLPVVSIAMEDNHRESSAEVNLSSVGPKEWISAIQQARFVVTKSFHGTMFSLRSGVPVLVVPGDEKAVPRLEDACNRFGLKGALIYPADCERDPVSRLKGVDWASVRQLMERHVRDSKYFLDKYVLQREG